MSRKKQNNHYHYAEKFEPRVQARLNRRMLRVPRKALFAAAIVLFLFGIISTTFASQVTEYYSTADNGASNLRVTLRSIKASREIADTGVNRELAASGSQYNYNWYGYLYFRAPDSWDLSTNSKVQTLWTQSDDADVSAYQDYAAEMSVVGTTSNSKLYYVYVGESHDGWKRNEWVAFTANSSAYGDGSFKLNTNAQYTKPYDYGYSNSTGSYYFCASDSSNNTASNNNTISGSYNDNTSTLLSRQHDCYLYTDGAASGDGGEVNISAYYLKTAKSSGSGAIEQTTSTKTSDSCTTSYTVYKAAVDGTKVTMTATPNTGYRFDGWYESTSATTPLETDTTYSYFSYGANTVYARFIATYDITVVKGTAGYTSNPICQSLTPKSETTNTKVYTIDRGASITLDAALQTGVSVVWTNDQDVTTSALGSYTVTPTADTTYTASYTLANPTISAFSYTPTSYLMERETGTPSLTAAAASGNSSNLSYAYSMAPKSGVSTAASGTYSVHSEGDETDGKASADVPGVYVVTVTVTESAYGLSSSSTSTTEITFTPNAPDFSRTVTGFADGDGETSGTRFQVPLNETSFVYSTAVSSPIEGYTYTWQTSTDGTNWTSAGTGTGTTITPVTTSSTSVIHLYIRVQAAYNGASILSGNDLTYYQIMNEFLRLDEFNFSTRRDPVQKIYNVNSAETLFASYTASSDNYTTNIYYSPDNRIFTSVLTVSDTATTPRSTFSFDEMLSAGPKWFYLITERSDQTRSVTSGTVHTTVGTNTTAGSYPIYFKSANTFTNQRVMAGFVVSGSPVYQTGQPVSDGNGGVRYYRFNVPAGATDVVFFITSTSYYKLPTFSSDTFTFSDTEVFCANSHYQYQLNSATPLFTAESFTDNANVVDTFEGSFGVMS